MGLDRDKLVPLVTAAQNGDPQALNALFNIYYNDVYYFALKTVKDSDLACDITQETFMEIYSTLGSLKEPAAFVTWSKQITYHQCTRYFKKKKDVLVDENEDGTSLFDTLEEENETYIPDASLDKEDFRNTIMAMIDTLSEEQRAAVMMYYFDEMSVSQIASIQGVSEGTVKSRLNYARKSIKASVEEYEEKHNIKLHSLALLPLLLWLFSADKLRTSLTPDAVRSIAQQLSEKLGMQFQTAHSDANTAQSAVEVAKHSAKVAKHAVQKNAAKAAVASSTKAGMSFGAKFGFFVLSVFGATVVGGAALLVAGVIGGPNLFSEIPDVFSSITGGNNSSVVSYPETPRPTVIPFEVSVSSGADVSHEWLTPFGEAHTLGDRLAAVYSNPYYVSDVDGNVYSVMDCTNPIANTYEMKEQYCFDNALVYLDYNDIYHVFLEGVEKWTFSGIVGEPIGVYIDEDTRYSSEIGCVVSYDGKYVYLSTFHMDGSVQSHFNSKINFYSRNFKKRFKQFDYVQCYTAGSDKLCLYVMSGNKAIIGELVSAWHFTYDPNDPNITVYFEEYVSANARDMYDFKFYAGEDVLTFEDVVLPEGYSSQDICQAFYVDKFYPTMVRFRDGSVYVDKIGCSCGQYSDGWIYNETLSYLAKENQNFMMLPFYNQAYHSELGDENVQRMVVVLDDGRMYEVSDELSYTKCLNCEVW